MSKSKFQKIIDYLRGKNELENLRIYNIMLKKLYTFDRKKDTINTIILGSSHGEYGYLADMNEMNLASSYQDLYYSYKIYEKCNNPHIKNIILFYSVFSPGSQTIKTDSAKYALTFKLLWDIPYQSEIDAKKAGLDKLEKRCKGISERTISHYKFDNTYCGNVEVYTSEYCDYKPEERTIPHYKNNQRNNNQTIFVEKISELAKKFNQKLYIVISPASNEYKSLLPPPEELFKELYEVSKRLSNTQIINCYNIPFKKNEFIDWDHCNLAGAKRLTQIIKQNIDT